MKFTSEDLMKAMGLNVGDRVKFDDDIWTVIYDENEIHTFYLHIKGGEFNHTMWLFELIDKHFEILPKPKRVGDLKCEECSCDGCPLRVINCRIFSKYTEKTLYEMLNVSLEEYFDQEIHDLLKARLDKEVVEE